MPLNITVTPEAPVPLSVQIKEQLRLAITFGDLHPGEILPSIRDLAERLHLGPGHVRKAYLELCSARILSSHSRKSFVVNHDLSVRKEDQIALRKRCTKLAAQVEKLCRADRIHPLSFAKYFFYDVLEREKIDPTLIFVHLTRFGAKELAEDVSLAFGVPVAAVSFEELKRGQIKREEFKLFLLNLYRLEQAAKLLRREEKPFKFIPVRLLTGPKILGRLRALSPNARVLCIFHESDYGVISQAVLSRLAEITADKRTKYICQSLKQFRQMQFKQLAKQYDLIAFSPHVWDEIAREIREHPKAVENDAQIDAISIEEVRSLCGVLM